MGIKNKTTVRLQHPIEEDVLDHDYWNDVIHWCLNQYGIPGKRFMTTANNNYMDFIFEDERDAVLFTLRWV